jgi:hypothetical protein
MKRSCLLCGWCLLSTASLFGQGADVFPSGESLVVEGVPAIEAALAENASRYSEFRSADLLDWHPTRREILIGTRFADSNQVHRVENPGGDRRQLTFFPDRVFAASFHPKRGDYFIFTKDKGGNEFFQLLGSQPWQTRIAESFSKRWRRGLPQPQRHKKLRGIAPKAVKDLRGVLDDKTVEAVWSAPPGHGAVPQGL